MSIQKSVLAGLLTLSCASASAFEIKDGGYGEGKSAIRNNFSYMARNTDGKDIKITNNDVHPSIRFQIRTIGNRLILTDLKRNLSYELNKSASGEQALPQSYIDQLSERPERLGALAQLVRKITVSEVQETDDSLKANINVYLGTNSSFGSIQAKVVLGASLTNTECFSSYYVYANGKNEYKTSQIKCLKANVGETVDLTSLTASGISGVVTETLGLIGDFTLKLSGPQVFRSVRLIRMNNGRQMRN